MMRGGADAIYGGTGDGTGAAVVADCNGSNGTAGLASLALACSDDWIVCMTAREARWQEGKGRNCAPLLPTNL